jgi:Ca-activated chloride channel family protein
MLNFKRLLIRLLLIPMTCIAAHAPAAGLLTPVNSQFKPLSIKTHDVKVIIHDSLAITQVDQVFHNSNSQSLEAIYSFPIPENAAVGGFTFWINGVVVEGEVVKKEQAQQIYQQEKASGHHVAVTQQDSHKTFDIKVYPVNANADVKIQLVYFQQQKVDTGIGRYVYPIEDGSVDEAKNEFWTRNEVVDERFSFTVDLRSSYAIDGVRVPKQPRAVIANMDKKHWSVLLSSELEVSDTPKILSDDKEQATNVMAVNNKYQLNQDIVIYWRQALDLPGSVDLISYRALGAKQGTFMLTLTPGDDLAQIKGQRDWVFVLDKSGSMEGKYDTLVEGVRQGLEQLPAGDRFKVVTFNDMAQDVSGGFQLTATDSIQFVLKQLSENGVGGGTNLYAGLKKGFDSLDSDRTSAIILVTDGVANVGITEKKRFLSLLDEHDVRLFSFVMGNSANRTLLEGMSKVSHGFYTSISNSDDIFGQIQLAASKLTHQSIRDVSIDIEGIRVNDLSTLDLPTVYRGQQMTVMGHYYGHGKANIKLTGQVNGEEISYNTSVFFPKDNANYPEIERLWAYSKIKSLESLVDYLGQDNDSEQAILDLSIAYSIVTKQTSLLVVEEDVFEKHGITQVNKKRRNRERQAQQKRSKKTINNRGDTNKSMFKKSRPSSGNGGGSMSLIGAFVLCLITWRRKYKI